MLYLLTFDFENDINVFDLNCDLLILIFNESFMGLHKWQHIKQNISHRGCGAK